MEKPFTENATRILVLGATGHIGQAFVRHALTSGLSVTAATRQAEPFALRGLDLRVVRLAGDLAGLPELAAEHDILVDAAAPYPLDPSVPFSHAWQQTVAGAVQRTERVLNATVSSRARLIFISSFSTLPRSESQFQAMETAWRRSAYPYFEAKLAMERAAMEAARRGVPVVIVNPAACLGPWEYRDAESSLVRMILARRLPVVMNQTVNVIDVRDVALGALGALELGYFGRPVPLAGHNIAMPALAGQIGALAGIAAPAAVDSRMASVAGFWAETMFGALGRPAPDMLRAVPLIADAFPMQPSPEQLAIGLSVRPLSDTLRDSVAFHRNRPPG